MVAWLVELLAYFAAEPFLDELMVNGLRGVSFVGGGGESGLLMSKKALPSPFASREEMLFSVQDFALEQGLRLDPLVPSVGGMLTGVAMRWHCLIPPAAPDGPVFILRRHRFEALKVEDFTGSAATLKQLQALMALPKPLLLCGPTGSGKTSLLAALLAGAAAAERVVIVEEFSELPLLGAGWLRLLARPAGRHGQGEVGVEDLLRISLRLRPERLVLGELRSSADLGSFARALASGHRGVCGTLHAGNPQQLAQRLRHSGVDYWQPIGPARGDEGADLWVAFLERGQPPQVGELMALQYR